MRKCMLCSREGEVVPVMVIPVIGYPIPVYLQLKEPLCRQHAAAFNMNDFTDYMGSWYDMVADHLRQVDKPAVNPYPDDPSFRWDEFRIKPNWEIGSREECKLEMWDVQVLGAKGMRQKLF